MKKLFFNSRLRNFKLIKYLIPPNWDISLLKALKKVITFKEK